MPPRSSAVARAPAPAVSAGAPARLASTDESSAGTSDSAPVDQEFVSDYFAPRITGGDEGGFLTYAAGAAAAPSGVSGRTRPWRQLRQVQAAINGFRLHRYTVPHGDDYTSETLARELQRRETLRSATEAWAADDRAWDGFVHAWLTAVVNQRYRQLAAFRSAIAEYKAAGNVGQPPLSELGVDAVAGVTEAEAAEAVEQAVLALKAAETHEAPSAKQLLRAQRQLRALPPVRITFEGFDAAAAAAEGRTVPTEILLAEAPSGASRLTESHVPYVLLERLPEGLDATPLLVSARPSRRPMPVEVDPTSYTLAALMQMRDPDLSIVRAVWRREAGLPAPPSLAEMARLSRPLAPDGPGADPAKASAAWPAREDTYVLPAAGRDPVQSTRDTVEAAFETSMDKLLGGRGASGARMDVTQFAQRYFPDSGHAELARQVAADRQSALAVAQEPALRELSVSEPEDMAKTLISLDRPSPSVPGLADLTGGMSARRASGRSPAEQERDRAALVLVGRVLSGEASADEVTAANIVAMEELRRVGLGGPSHIHAQGPEAVSSWLLRSTLGNDAATEAEAVARDIKRAVAAARAEAAEAEAAGRPVSDIARRWIARDEAQRKLASELTRRGVAKFTPKSAGAAAVRNGKRGPIDIADAVHSLPAADRRALADDPAATMLGAVHARITADAAANERRAAAMSLRMAGASVAAEHEAAADRITAQSEGSIRPPEAADGESMLRNSAEASSMIDRFLLTGATWDAAGITKGALADPAGAAWEREEKANQRRKRRGKDDGSGVGVDRLATTDGPLGPGDKPGESLWPDSLIFVPASEVMPAEAEEVLRGGAQAVRAYHDAMARSGSWLEHDAEELRSRPAGRTLGECVAEYRRAVKAAGAGASEEEVRKLVSIETAEMIDALDKHKEDPLALVQAVLSARVRRARAIKDPAMGFGDRLAPLDSVDQPAALKALRRWSGVFGGRTVVDYLVGRKPLDTAPHLLRPDIRRVLGARESARLTAERRLIARSASQRFRNEADVVVPPKVFDAFIRATDPFLGSMAKRAADRQGSFLTDLLARLETGAARIAQRDYDLMVKPGASTDNADAVRIRDSIRKAVDDAISTSAEGEARAAIVDSQSFRAREVIEAARLRATELAAAGHTAEAVLAAKEALLVLAGEQDPSGASHDDPRLVAEAQLVNKTADSARAEAEAYADELGIAMDDPRRASFIESASTTMRRAALAHAKARWSAIEDREAWVAPDIAAASSRGKALRSSLKASPSLVVAALDMQAARAGTPEALPEGSVKSFADWRFASEELAPQAVRDAEAEYVTQYDSLVAFVGAGHESGVEALRLSAETEPLKQKLLAAEKGSDASLAAIRSEAEAAAELSDEEAALQSLEALLKAEGAAWDREADAIGSDGEAAPAYKPLTQEDRDFVLEARRRYKAVAAAKQAFHAEVRSLMELCAAAEAATDGTRAATGAGSGSGSDDGRMVLSARRQAFLEKYGLEPTAQLVAAAKAAAARAADVLEGGSSAFAAEADATVSTNAAAAGAASNHVVVSSADTTLAPAEDEYLRRAAFMADGDLVPLGPAEGFNDGLGTVGVPPIFARAAQALRSKSKFAGGVADGSFDPFVAAARQLAAEGLTGEGTVEGLLAEMESSGSAAEDLAGTDAEEEAAAAMLEGSDAEAADSAAAFVAGGTEAGDAQAGSDAEAAAATAAGQPDAEEPEEEKGPSLSDEELERVGFKASFDSALRASGIAAGEDAIVSDDDGPGLEGYDDDGIGSVFSDEERQGDGAMPDASGPVDYPHGLTPARMGEGEGSDGEGVTGVMVDDDELLHGEARAGADAYVGSDTDVDASDGPTDPLHADDRRTFYGYMEDDGLHQNEVPAILEPGLIKLAADADAEAQIASMARRADAVLSGADTMAGLDAQAKVALRKQLLAAKAALNAGASEVVDIFAARGAPLDAEEAKAVIDSVDAQFGPQGATPDAERRSIMLAVVHEEQQRLAEGRPYGQPSSIFREVFRGTALGSQIDAQLASHGLHAAAPGSAFVPSTQLDNANWRANGAVAAADTILNAPVSDDARAAAILDLADGSVSVVDRFALNAARRFLAASYGGDEEQAAATAAAAAAAAAAEAAASAAAAGAADAGPEPGTVLRVLPAGRPMSADEEIVATRGRVARASDALATQLFAVADEAAGELATHQWNGWADPTDSLFAEDGVTTVPDIELDVHLVPMHGIQAFAAANRHSAGLELAARSASAEQLITRMGVSVGDWSEIASTVAASEAALALARDRAGRDMPAGTALLPRGGGPQSSHGATNPDGTVRPIERRDLAEDEIAAELLEGAPLAASRDPRLASLVRAAAGALEQAGAADGKLQRLLSAPAHEVVIRAAAASPWNNVTADQSAAGGDGSGAPGAGAGSLDDASIGSSFVGGPGGNEEQDLAMLMRAAADDAERSGAQSRGLGLEGIASDAPKPTLAETQEAVAARLASGVTEAAADAAFAKAADAEVDLAKRAAAAATGAIYTMPGGAGEMPNAWVGGPDLGRTTTMAARLRRAEPMLGGAGSERRTTLDLFTGKAGLGARQQPWDLHHSINYETHHYRMLEAVEHRDLDMALLIFRNAITRRGVRAMLSGRDDVKRAEGDIRGTGDFGDEPDWLAANILLDAAARSRTPAVADEVLLHIARRGGELGHDQLSLLLKGATLRGDLWEARRCYSLITSDCKGGPTLADHTAMMAAQFYAGRHAQAIATLNHVIRNGETPTSHMFSLAFRYLSRDGKFEELHHVWRTLRSTPGAKPGGRTLARLLRAFARGGRLDDAWEVFLAMRSGAHGRLVPDRDTLVILFNMLVESKRVDHAKRMLAFMDALGHLGPRRDSAQYRARVRSGDVDAAMQLRDDLEACLESLDGTKSWMGDRLRVRGPVDKFVRYGIPFHPEDAVEDKRRWAAVWQRMAVDVGTTDAFFGDDFGRTLADDNSFTMPDERPYEESMEDRLEELAADREFRA
ncbi:hypothetical protein FNF27_03038 [Cafeteria roenbergensis]|uniref:Uncharacterized protein n=1 Tax=Cafeteria roenbergensis TaxID=33653 RepID=A0A5A8EBX2_CAFRO|nr:hypothetical protein FNF27_03038 [Cafeteria roenbergensis]